MARVWLRLEGFLLAVAAVVAYGAAGGSWATFLVFFVLPDVVGWVPFAWAARRLERGEARRSGDWDGPRSRRRPAAQAAEPLIAPRWFLSTMPPTARRCPCSSACWGDG